MNTSKKSKLQTCTSRNNASRTLSFVITGPLGAGVRDGGGVGGGKGWSKGVPYGCCMVRGGCRGGAVGIEDEICGIINEDEDRGEKNEGLTRFVERLRLLLDSWASRKGIKGADEVGKAGADWRIGSVDGMTFGVWEEGREKVAGDGCGCPVIAVFGAFPVFIAACKMMKMTASTRTQVWTHSCLYI